MEIKIPKEVRDYHENIFFGLNTRQFICSVLAVGGNCWHCWGGMLCKCCRW